MPIKILNLLPKRLTVCVPHLTEDKWTSYLLSGCSYVTTVFWELLCCCFSCFSPQKRQKSWLQRRGAGGWAGLSVIRLIEACVHSFCFRV